MREIIDVAIFGGFTLISHNQPQSRRLFRIFTSESPQQELHGQ
jgi:hypothetical protein